MQRNNPLLNDNLITDIFLQADAMMNDAIQIVRRTEKQPINGTEGLTAGGLFSDTFRSAIFSSTTFVSLPLEALNNTETAPQFSARPTHVAQYKSR